MTPYFPPDSDGFRIIEDGQTSNSPRPPAETKTCIYCTSRIPRTAAMCPSCDRTLIRTPEEEEAEEGTFPDSGEPATSMRPSPFPGELMLAVAIVGSLLALDIWSRAFLRGYRTEQWLLPTHFLQVLMLLGLIIRTGWGRWLSIVLLSLYVLVGMYFYVTVMDWPAPYHPEHLLYYMGAYVLALVLLIFSRIKGTYDG